MVLIILFVWLQDIVMSFIEPLCIHLIAHLLILRLLAVLDLKPELSHNFIPILLFLM